MISDSGWARMRGGNSLGYGGGRGQSKGLVSGFMFFGHIYRIYRTMRRLVM